MASKKKPNHEIRFGAIRASIWVNENRDGSRWYTATFGRLFKDDQDKWQVAQNYKVQHLPDLARSIAAAHDWMDQRTIHAEAKTLVRELVQQATNVRSESKGRA